MARNFSASAQSPQLLYSVSSDPSPAPDSVGLTHSDDEGTPLGGGLRLNLDLMANTRQASTKSAPSCLVRESVSRCHARNAEAEQAASRENFSSPSPLQFSTRSGRAEASLVSGQSNRTAEDEAEIRAQRDLAAPLALSYFERGAGKRRLSNSSREPKIWKFRGVITAVSDQLFVGDVNAARDYEALHRLGITHVLNCAAANIANFHAANGLTYKRVTMEDNPTEDIFCLFWGVLRFMEEAIEAGGRVFVHCNYGISRSSTMAICYLMHARNWSYDEATQHLKSLRSICEPNAGYVLSLMNWDRHRANPRQGLPALFSVREKEAPGNGTETTRVNSLPLLSSSDCMVFHCEGELHVFVGGNCSESRAQPAFQLVENLQKYAQAPGTVAMVKIYSCTQEYHQLLLNKWKSNSSS